jgi:hypothetical protein
MCPQCKAEIQIDRKYSGLINVVNKAESYLSMATVPALVMTVAGGFWTACLCYGINTVYIIFGDEDAAAVFAHAQVRNYRGMGVADMLSRVILPFAPVTHLGWRAYLGLPMLPAALVMSRSTYADIVLPIFPLLFFMRQGSDFEKLDLTSWPPSAPVVLSMLPYLRSCYNALYERAFGDLIKSWNRELEPRLTSGDDASNTPADQANAGVDARNRGEAAQHDQGADESDGEDDVDMVIRVEAGLGDGNMLDMNVMVDEINPNNEQDIVEALEEAIEAVQVRVNEVERNQNAREQARQGPAQVVAAANNGGAREYVFSPEYSGRRALGALLFPSVAAAMGMLLKATLPKYWTTRQAGSPVVYLLQKRWGRSVIGGCLFIVLKDALSLLYRWQMVRAFKTRRVLDYKGKRAQGGVLKSRSSQTRAES